MSYPVIANVVLETFFISAANVFLFGRSQTADVDDTPSQLYINNGGAYSLNPTMDMSFPIVNAVPAFPMQFTANGKRYYGFSYIDFCMVADFRGYLYLASKAASTTWISDVLIANVGNLTYLVFQVPGTPVAVNAIDGFYTRYNAGAVTTCVYPINVVEGVMYPIMPEQFPNIITNPFNEHPSMVTCGIQSGIPSEFIFTYYDSVLQVPTDVVTKVGVLGNPYDDPSNPALSITYSGPAVTTSTGSVINLTIGGATYNLKYPYYFWVLLSVAVVFLVVLVILLVVAHYRKKKYVKSETPPVTKSSAPPNTIPPNRPQPVRRF